jgi:hypothetical protein
MAAAWVEHPTFATGAKQSSALATAPSLLQPSSCCMLYKHVLQERHAGSFSGQLALPPCDQPDLRTIWAHFALVRSRPRSRSARLTPASERALSLSAAAEQVWAIWLPSGEPWECNGCRLIPALGEDKVCSLSTQLHLVIQYITFGLHDLMDEADRRSGRFYPDASVRLGWQSHGLSTPCIMVSVTSGWNPEESTAFIRMLASRSERQMLLFTCKRLCLIAHLFNISGVYA